MENLKVKPEFIGACTSVKGIGQIKIREDHAAILARAGRFELLEGSMPVAKKLIPIPKNEEECIPCLNTDQLKEKAKNLPGYKPNMKKVKLIELIRNA